MLDVIGFGLAAFLLSCIGVAGVRRWAERRQLLDIPNERSSHTRPTPRGGGLVIVVLSTAGLILAWLRYPTASPTVLIAYLVGAWLIAGVSWVDDLRSLPNRMRFGAHSLGAVLVILGIGHWGVVDLPLLGAESLGWLGVIITFLWIVGLTNAYNFMDGIDGIAGGQAVIAGIGWAALGCIGSNVGRLMGILLAASSLGFLGHNWPPARIFMGDVGSAFLGFTFAALAVAAAQRDARLALAGILLVWPFVFDATFTFLRRLCRRENVFAAHRSHLYQRLVIAGCSHRAVTLLYIGLAAAGAILALLWTLDVAGSSLLIVVSMPVLCWGLCKVVWRRERMRNP